MKVAVAGLVLATVLGSLIGIGRRSRNAVLRSLCTTYVEIVRNIPSLVLCASAERFALSRDSDCVSDAVVWSPPSSSKEVVP